MPFGREAIRRLMSSGGTCPSTTTPCTIAVWQDGAKSITVPVRNGRTIKKVTLGSTYTPDSYPADNVWTAAE